MVKILLLFVSAAVAVYSFPQPESEVSSTSEKSLTNGQHTNSNQEEPPVLYTSSISNPQLGTLQNENRRVRETNNQKATSSYDHENTPFSNNNSNNQASDAIENGQHSNDYQGVPSVLYTPNNSNTQNENKKRSVRETNNQKTTELSSSSSYGVKNTAFNNDNSNNQSKDVTDLLNTPKDLISSEQRITSTVLADTNDKNLQTKNIGHPGPQSTSVITPNINDDSEKATTEDPDDIGVFELNVPYPKE